jgi:hypothetical protein
VSGGWVLSGQPADSRAGLVRAVDDPDSGTTYEPWTDGWAVGYRVTFADGRVEYFYLNPSGGSDDNVPNVFVYRGEAGDPGSDTPQHHYDLTREGE